MKTYMAKAEAVERKWYSLFAYIFSFLFRVFACKRLNLQKSAYLTGKVGFFKGFSKLAYLFYYEKKFKSSCFALVFSTFLTFFKNFLEVIHNRVFSWFFLGFSCKNPHARVRILKKNTRWLFQKNVLHLIKRIRSISFLWKSEFYFF